MTEAKHDQVPTTASTDTMPQPGPGSFCWNELSTTDVAAATSFYGGLLGWTFRELDSPMGPYTEVRVDGRAVGGIMKQSEAGRGSVWLGYVGVEDVEAALARSIDLGGRTVLPATSIDEGVIAVVEDPVGGRLGLWTPKADPS